MIIKRNRTTSLHIGYGLYLYFLGLSTRSIAKALSFLHIIIREAIYPYGNGFKNTHLKIYCLVERKISEYIIDETMIKVGSSEFIWL